MANLSPSPEFSLIISTLGPADRLRQCLASIMEQSYSSFEVIVVDQNATDHVRKIVAEFRETGKVHHTRSQVGLSKGRNAGLALARGRIVAFPDDDCEYPVTVLADVKAWFLSDDDLSGICIRCCDRDGRDSAGRSARKKGLVTKSNVWGRGVSVGIFLKAEVTKEIGGFNEDLGLGSKTPYQSGEETDLLLRLISRGCKIHYEPSLRVLHPRMSSKITSDDINMTYNYALGAGRVLRRHKYNKFVVAWHCLRPILGAFAAIASGKLNLAQLRYRRAIGRFDGWRSSLPSVSRGQ